MITLMKLFNCFQPHERVYTKLTLDPQDAEFLKKELLRLPVSERGDCPVTLLCDYDGSVTVHPETNRDDGSAAEQPAWSLLPSVAALSVWTGIRNVL